MSEQDQKAPNPLEAYKHHIHLLMRARFRKDFREEDEQLSMLDHYYLQCDEVQRNQTKEYCSTVIAPMIAPNGVPTELPPLYIPT